MKTILSLATITLACLFASQAHATNFGRQAVVVRSAAVQVNVRRGLFAPRVQVVQPVVVRQQFVQPFAISPYGVQSFQSFQQPAYFRQQFVSPVQSFSVPVYGGSSLQFNSGGCSAFFVR